MNLFQHLEPPLRVFAGESSLAQLRSELDRAGCRRAVILCGPTLARGAALQFVVQALGDKFAGVFGGVRPHSPVDTVLVAAAQLRKLGADAVVAVGGGSAIVTARAAAILLAEGEDVRRLCTQRAMDGSFTSPKLLAPKLAQFVVPTTPTTAVAKAGSALFDTAAQERLALFDSKTRAHAVFVHPALVATAPTSLVLSAALNGLTMACEGLESTAAEPLADALLMHGLRLYRDHLPRLVADPASAEKRVQLVLASVLTGRGTDHAGGGLASVLGHAIGARCHIENGIANAIVLPHTMRFNAGATRDAMAHIGEVFSGLPGCGTEETISRIQAFVRGLGVPGRLRDTGVAAEDLEAIAAASMQDWFLGRNPRRVNSVNEVRGVLQAAW